jgi:glycogen debranching enzyme
MTTSPNRQTQLIHRAIRIAIGDLTSNIALYKAGLLNQPEPCLMAGLDYDMPWTRDAAFNTWYGLGLLAPNVARNTLLSVLEREADDTIRIGGQYWDAIIWAQGLWTYFLYTGDHTVLELGLTAIENSLAHFEATERDPIDGLFRGGACFQDGIAAYPDYFAPTDVGYSGIMSYLERKGAQRAPVGVGIPCKALSTNCLYYRAYEIAGLITKQLGLPEKPAHASKALALKQAINSHFWRKTKGTYGYLLDAPEHDDRQEGLGLAFALLFGIADDSQATRIFENVHLTPHGMACVWPAYPRYRKEDHYGRHSGTIWPQVNAAWALACQKRGRPDLARQELLLLAEKACRDSEFAEVYHPHTGLPYGGLQEEHDHGPKPELYWVCHRQSWCASGYLAMVLTNFIGIEFKDELLPAEAHRKIHQTIPCLEVDW